MMKKTVAALALSASSTSFALMMPPQETKVICLNVYENADGVKFAGSCDNTRNNIAAGVKLEANHCAAEQISLTSVKYNGAFDINVRSCLPPNIAQL